MPKAGMTVDKAKAAVLAEEKRLVSFIPPEFVARHQQLTESYLLSCSATGSYTWPDQGVVTLNGNPDVGPILRGIAEKYTRLPGFKVSFDTTVDGAERLMVSGDDGADYLVSPLSSDTELRIATFSACFTLGPDQWPGDAY